MSQIINDEMNVENHASKILELLKVCSEVDLLDGSNFLVSTIEALPIILLDRSTEIRCA